MGERESVCVSVEDVVADNNVNAGNGGWNSLIRQNGTRQHGSLLDIAFIV